MKEQFLKFTFFISFILVVTLTFLIIKNDGSLTSNALSSSSTSSVNEPNDSVSSQNIDICRCLTEPGNSNYMMQNGKACDNAISIAIGVENWRKVNMSQNPIISNRFDALANRCR